MISSVGMTCYPSIVFTWHEKSVRSRLIGMLAIAIVVHISPCSSYAWSEAGHHAITLLAYDLLTDGEKETVTALLISHPRYKQDFQPPKNLRDNERWQIGQIGYWPDVARDQPKYDRPTWHYQLGATLALGDISNFIIPANPGPLPSYATLATQELHIAQALDLCVSSLSDKSVIERDRSVALCWIAHLVADAHQPCHAGSLYVANLFEEGDRGANEIKTLQSDNLHAFWDNALGKSYCEELVNKTCYEVSNFPYNLDLLKKSLLLHSRDPILWLHESREYSRQLVYADEILRVVTAVQKGKLPELPEIHLSQNYINNAHNLARIRAFQAAHRLASVWRVALEKSKHPRHIYFVPKEISSILGSQNPK